MPGLILAIDQGTTSSRALLVNQDAEIVSVAQRSIEMHYPAPGWVNQDAENIWATTRTVCDEAIARAKGALDLGVDMVFVESPETIEELEAIPKALSGKCVLNMVPGGRTPMVSQSEARRMGYSLVIYPGVALLAAMAGIDDALGALKTGEALTPRDSSTLTGFYQRLGSQEWDAIRNGGDA